MRYLGLMRGPVRGVIFGLLFCTWALTAALAPPGLAQTPTTPQQPFSQLVDVWTRQLDRIWTKYTGNPPPYGLRDPKIDEKRVLFVCRINRIATFGKP